MKMIIVALALVALAAAASVPGEPIPIVRSNFDQTPEGGYSFGYETGNGIVRTENGEVKEVLDEDKKPHSVVVVRGSYTYTDNEGNVETINYIADENGYQADGPSIPKVPSRR